MPYLRSDPFSLAFKSERTLPDFLRQFGGTGSLAVEAFGTPFFTEVHLTQAEWDALSAAQKSRFQTFGPTGFTGGATGTEAGVLGLPTLGGVNVGFLDDILTTIERSVPIARDLGLLPPAQLPVIVNAGGAGGPGQTGIPVVDFAGLPAIIPPLVRQLPGIVGGLGAGALLDFFGTDAVAPRVAGIRRAGEASGLFHSTPSGQRRPNRVSLASDASGVMGFFVDAGRPLTWSKVSLKKSSPRHHHHRR